MGLLHVGSAAWHLVSASTPDGPCGSWAHAPDSRFATQCEAFRGSVRVKSDTGLVGLWNLGNTCYMNSILQALFALPGFRRRILQCFNVEQVRNSRSSGRCRD